MSTYAGLTPYTIGGSACGRGSSFDGVKRLRAVAAVMPSTLAWMTRKSLKFRPARYLADLLQRLRIRRLARFDDQVPDAELLDERHHFLLRAGADRQHRDDRRHAEDHPEHRQQRTQLVRAEVVEAHPEVGQEVGVGRRQQPAARSSSRALRRPAPAARAGRGRVPGARRSDRRARPRCLPARRGSRARLSVRCSTFTSRCSKRSPIFTKT